MSGRIIVERDVPVRMRDGVVLRADVYRPDVEFPLPAIVSRLPYNKDDLLMMDAHPILTAEHGYAMVFQDTRGRYKSGGEFYPFVAEGLDGYDTVEWTAEQSWCNGDVGLVGASYIGATLWMASALQPPHLRAAFSMFTSSEYYEGWTYQGGAFQLGFTLLWTLGYLAWETADRWSDRGLLDADEPERLLSASNRLMVELYGHMPLSDLPVLADSGTAPYYFDWIEHETRDDYWTSTAVNEGYDRITVPVYHVGGWYDIFLLGTLENFTRLQREAGSETARSGQRLLIGPWGHANQSGAFPELRFGPMASLVQAGVLDRQLQFFDQTLKGRSTCLDEESPVRIFVMGENRWRDEDAWPLSLTAYECWYLHSDGMANTQEGTLSPTLPGVEPPDAYLYNPRDPCPTLGGPVFLPGIETGADAGPRDQRSVEMRADVLSYTSVPLGRPLEVTGPLRMNLWAATSATDTDFVVRLCDVHPDGRSIILAEGVIRTRFRRGCQTSTPVEPGEITAFNVDLVATSNVFQPGHSIRVDITSSSWPRFNANPNTGHRLGSDGPGDVRVALQTVAHSERYPSHIVLPVIPR